MDPTVAKILARQRAQANAQGTSNGPAQHIHIHGLVIQVPEGSIQIPPTNVEVVSKAPDVHVHPTVTPPSVEVHPPAAVQRKVDFELDEMGRIKAANVTDGR